MTLTQFLLHAGHESDGALGYNVLPADPVALWLIAIGIVLIVGGLYRLHTYDPVPEPIDEDLDA